MRPSREQRARTRGFKSRALKEDYAEILRLIDRLQAGKRQGRVRPPVPSFAGGSVARPSAPRPVSPLGPRADALPNGTAQKVLELLEDVHARVGRIESTLGRASPGAVSGGGVPDTALFGGVVREDILADMLQLVTSNQLTGTFVVSSSSTSYSLFFRDGELFHAQGGKLSGEQAVFAAVALGAGRYHFAQTSDLPSEKTISSNTQLLVLEALRQIDESQADGT